jgi:hypothetical protein
MRHEDVLDELRERDGPAKLRAALLLSVRRDQMRREQAGSLMAFIRHFWHIVEPNKKFVEGWALHAMCLHLEAVDRGEITRLLITVPPGAMKSLLCSVFFPLWQWGPRNRPQQRYLNFSYASHLTQRDNGRMLQILKSPEWRELWGPRKGGGFALDAEGKEKIATNKTGWKLATSIGGVGTGERGDGVILDDPHSIKDDKSEVVRPETVRFFKEAMSNRLNDMEQSFIIAIMQRSHEADVAGEIVNENMGYVHLNIPMEYEFDQHCMTFVQHGPRKGQMLWQDPRTVEGECFWPERFPPDAVAAIKKLGVHMWNGQYQQRPEPRGGAILLRSYWKPYTIPTEGKRKGKWPQFEYVLASLDSAFTEKTENDPSGFTIWGVFQAEDGSMCAMLLQAWRKWLTLGGTKKIPVKAKHQSWGDYKQETEQHWGIVQWMRYECHRFKTDQLLIEAKASGHDIYHEMQKHAAEDPWNLTLVDPGNLDKLARIHRVQPIYAEGLVWAVLEKPFSKLAIDEAAAAPRGKFRDITDSSTQALHYLRKNGYLEHVDVALAREMREREKAGKKPKGLKPLYGV